MPAHFIDYEIQENIFSTKELKDFFDEKTKIQRWLTIEATLAEVQAEMNIIPREAAMEISKKASLNYLDINSMKKDYQNSNNTLQPILNALRKACDKEYGEFVHYGATTQDIIDTNQMLEIKQALSVFYRDLRKFENILIILAEKYIDTPMVGRTHGQYAAPITFGLKVSVWISEVRRHIERIKSLSSRVLVGQLSGAVGTMAALGERAKELSKRIMEKLGLMSNDITWHTSRDNIVEICTCFTMIVGTITKISNEIFQLSKSDVLELKECGTAKKLICSSTMPHKNNPVLCERIIALSKHVRALNGVILESMVHENERDPRSLWAEWLTIPQLIIYSGATLAYVINIFKSLEIYPEVMLKNLYRFGELIVSEFLLFRLAKYLGKMQAQEILHQIIKFSEAHSIPFKQALIENLKVKKCLNEKDFKMIEHPELYVGNSRTIVKSLLTKIKKTRNLESNTVF